jgi:hypothetical protein
LRIRGLVDERLQHIDGFLRLPLLDTGRGENLNRLRIARNRPYDIAEILLGDLQIPPGLADDPEQ